MSLVTQIKTAVPLLALGLTCSCFVGGEGQPVVGGWRSLQTVGGYHNSLEITPDNLEGSAVVYFGLSGEKGVYVDSFAAGVRVLGEERYTIEMRCDFDDPDCVDFELSCRVATVEGGHELLDCRGNGVFESYENFTFQRMW